MNGQKKSAVFVTVSLMIAALSLAACQMPVSAGPEVEALLNSPEAAARALTNGPIQVLTVKATADGHYGITSHYRYLTIRVKNLGFEKSLILYGEKADGTWGDLSQSYAAYLLGPAGDGFELWAISTAWSSYYGQEAWGDEFVVRYTVNGQTYWDNNGGANFKMGPNVGTIMTSGAGDIRLENVYASEYVPYMWGTVVLRNVAFQKTVEIRYTTDNWATVKSAFATYRPYVYIPYGSAIANPNQFGVESWAFEIFFDAPVDRSKIQLAVGYTPAGSYTRWDNNFGANYRVVQ